MSTNLKGTAENDMFCYEVLDKGNFDPFVVLVEARITTVIRIYLLGTIKIHASPFNN